MTKLADKRIAIAKQVLETTDLAKLEAVEEVLRGRIEFSPAEIAEFETQLELIDRGEELTVSWAEVKKKLMANRRK